MGPINWSVTLYRLKMLAKVEQSSLLVPLLVTAKIKCFEYTYNLQFKTLHFLWNFRMDPISWSATLYRLKMLAKDKQSSLLAPFVSYE
jgi:hypothetical protein